MSKTTNCLVIMKGVKACAQQSMSTIGQLAVDLEKKPNVCLCQFSNCQLSIWKKGYYGDTDYTFVTHDSSIFIVPQRAWDSVVYTINCPLSHTFFHGLHSWFIRFIKKFHTSFPRLNFKLCFSSAFHTKVLLRNVLQSHCSQKLFRKVISKNINVKVR